jgi:hypothetical protein
MTPDSGAWPTERILAFVRSQLSETQAKMSASSLSQPFALATNPINQRLLPAKAQDFATGVHEGAKLHGRRTLDKSPDCHIAFMCRSSQTAIASNIL